MSLTLKFVFIGDAGGGKSAINTKMITGIFNNASNTSTIGAIYGCRQMVRQSQVLPQVKINFWDTAGQERFRSIVPMYYRGSSAILMVYDLTNRSSFQSLVDYWAHEIRGQTFIKVFLIGNKTDLKQRAISHEEAKQFAQEIEADYYEISAKYDDLEPVLNSMVDQVCIKIDEAKLTMDKLQFYGVKIEGPKLTPSSKGCCNF